MTSYAIIQELQIKVPNHPKGKAFNNLSSAAMVWQCAGSLLQRMQQQHFWKPAIANILVMAHNDNVCDEHTHH